MSDLCVTEQLQTKEERLHHLQAMERGMVKCYDGEDQSMVAFYSGDEICGTTSTLAPQEKACIDHYSKGSGDQHRQRINLGNINTWPKRAAVVSACLTTVGMRYIILYYQMQL